MLIYGHPNEIQKKLTVFCIVHCMRFPSLTQLCCCCQNGWEACLVFSLIFSCLLARLVPAEPFINYLYLSTWDMKRQISQILSPYMSSFLFKSCVMMTYYGNCIVVVVLYCILLLSTSTCYRLFLRIYVTITQQLYYRFRYYRVSIFLYSCFRDRDSNLRSCIVGAGAGCFYSIALSGWFLQQASLMMM